MRNNNRQVLPLSRLNQRRQQPLARNDLARVNEQYVGYMGQGDQQTDEVFEDESGRSFMLEPFTYSLDFTLTGGQAFSQVQTIQIQAEAEFILMQRQYEFFDSSAETATSVLSRLTPSGAKVQLTDSGSGRNLLNELTPIASLFGDGLLPYLLPTPKAFAASTVLRVNVDTGTNTLSANDTTLILTFSGMKIYYLD